MSTVKKSIAAFAVPPNVHLLDFGGPAHVFYEAIEEGASFELQFVSIMSDVKSTSSSCGIQFSNLVDFKALTLGDGDMIFVPGLDFQLLSNADFILSSSDFLRWLRQQYGNGAMICSICTGAFLVAEAGLLAGKECTTHWRYLKRFQQRFKGVQVISNRLFVQCDKILTSAGVASGIDLALFILEQRCGSLFASKIAREIVVYCRRESHDPQLSIFLQYRNHLNDRIHTVQEWLVHHFHSKISMEQLAEKVNTSPRHLTRQFKETTGVTIGQYLEKLRIERAIQLLKDNHKVEVIATECGFQSTNQLRQLFKKHTGMVPSNYRMS